MDMEISIIPLCVVALASAIAAVTDVRTYRVYNVITVPLIVAGLVYHTVTGGFDGFIFSLSGAAVGFCVLIVPYMLGAMGAGDVKLLTGFGAWLGVPATGLIALIGCMATGIYSVVCLFLRGGWHEVWLSVQVSAFRLQTLGRQLASDQVNESIQEMRQHPEYRKRLIPFSLMLGLGVFAVIAFHLATGH